MRRRVLAFVAVVVLFLLVTSLRGIASFYTDSLWFSSLHQHKVWSGVLGAKVALAVIFSVVAFVLLLVNVTIANRLTPSDGGLLAEDEIVVHFQQAVGSHLGWVRFGAALVVGLFAGVGASAQWNNWLLFTNRVDFPGKDATLHTNIGFYVFQLPFLTFVVGWLFSTLVLVVLVSAFVHYLNGGVRVQGPGPLSGRVQPQVGAHLSVLLGLMALVKGGSYWLARYHLVFSTRGTVEGATYTDVNVQMKVLYLLVAISVFACVLFVVNVWRRGWVLPVMAVGLWGLVSVIAGAAVPAFVQRFRVQPAESSMERPFIAHNIAATREASGLSKVKVKSFASDGKLDSADLRDNAATIRNVRLWDTSTLQQIFTKLQGIRGFYEVNDVDVDRYNLDGQQTQVMVASRDLATSQVPQQSWEATHLAYTHGYGAMLAPANSTDLGQPVFQLSDIPVVAAKGAPKVTRPQVYFGEDQSEYVVVGTKRQEIDYTDAANDTRFTTYTGADGVEMGSGFMGLVRKASFALRFGDVNPLISGDIGKGSRIIIERDVRGRVQKLAPFLSFDADPYVVVQRDGHLVYVIDGYTTSSYYPNAQALDTSGLPASSGLAQKMNYVRNSVKATVDAYDGTVKLYVVDPSDPIVRAYRKAFPSLFTDASKIPAELRSHFRYPEDLFRVQTNMWGRYHLTNPDDFYNQQGSWQVALDANKLDQRGDQSMDPNYLLMRLPGDTDESFIELRPFVPVQKGTVTPQKQLLTGFMTAKSDVNDYGQLELYEVPGDNLRAAPSNVTAQMMSDAQVSGLQTLLCNGKTGLSAGASDSNCLYGDTLLVPINQNLLFVRPWYVMSSGTNLPQLAQVIVAYVDADKRTRVAVSPTFHDSLAKLFGPDVPATMEANPPDLGDLESQIGGASGGSGGSGVTTTTVAGSGGSATTVTTPPTPTSVAGPTTTVAPGSTAELVQRLNAAFAAADESLKQGDLAGYQRHVQEAQAIAAQLEKQGGGASR